MSARGSVVLSNIARVALFAALLSSIGCTDPEGDAARELAASAHALLADGGVVESDAMRPDHMHASDAAVVGTDAAPSDTDAAPSDTDAAPSDTDAAPSDTDAAPSDTDASSETPHHHEEDGGVDPDASVEPEDPALEHCRMQMPADPRDATLDPTPVILPVRRSQDVLLPQPIIDWMGEQGWETSHDAWHTTRTWDARCGTSFAPAEGCTYAQNLIADGLWRAEFQQGAPGSGLAFLAMHRHMIAMFKQAFPTHGELFRGFSHVPRTGDDPENPTPWRAPTWTESNLAGFDILENIEQHLDMFPTDDDLGLFIETNVRWSVEDPAARMDILGAGVHGALHRAWTVFGSPANLGGTDTSLRNYTFWKLHGYIDDVWTRYRAAKGLTDSEPSYQSIQLSECVLMYYLVPERRADAPDDVRN